jgi:hypothetical protein
MPSALEYILRNKRVKSEIERYKWIESEKAGYDIGFQVAARDWLELYGVAWLRKHPVPARRKAACPRP